MEESITVNNMHMLRLEPVLNRKPEDITAVLNDETISRNSLSIPYPYSIEDAETFFKFCSDFYADKNYSPGYFIMNQSDMVLGGIGMLPHFNDGSHTREIGYWLGKDYRRKGIMQASIITFCNYLYKHHQVVRIEAQVFSWNQPSARLLEKCGFLLEGFLKKRFRKKDEWIDSYLYAKLME